MDRTYEIINQTGVKSIITSNNDLNLKSLNKIELKFNNVSTDDLNIKEISESKIAYILFTSGSTGKPKGVVIKRYNIGQFFSSFWQSGIKIDSNDKCLQCFDLTFDVSIQTFIALVNGACIYTVPNNKIKFSYVYDLLENNNLTFAVMVPSMLRYLKPFFSEINLTSLKNCILTAEASSLDLIEEWYKCMPNGEICNFYGPTEATIYCTFYKVPRLNIKSHVVCCP